MRSYRCQKCGRLHLLHDDDPAVSLCYACWRKTSLLLYPENLFCYEGPETKDEFEAREEEWATALTECMRQEDVEKHRRWVVEQAAKALGEMA